MCGWKERVSPVEYHRINIYERTKFLNSVSTMFMFRPGAHHSSTCSRVRQQAQATIRAAVVSNRGTSAGSLPPSAPSTEKVATPIEKSERFDNFDQ